MARGDAVLQITFDKDYRIYGDTIANGDRTYSSLWNTARSDRITDIARDGLKAINVHLQQQLISKLKLHWQQDAHIELDALLEISDSVQERSLKTLEQLRQRIFASGVVDDESIPPTTLITKNVQRPLPAEPAPANSPIQEGWDFDFNRPRVLTPPRSPPERSKVWEHEWSAASTFALPVGEQKAPINNSTNSKVARSIPLVSVASQQTLLSPSSSVFSLPQRHSPSQPFPKRSDSPPSDKTSHHREGSKGSSESNEGGQNQYKPLATTTEKVGFLGFRKKKVEMIPDLHENPLVDKYLNEAIEIETRSLRRGSLGTQRSRISDPDEISVFPYQEDDDRTSILSDTTIEYPRPMERVPSGQVPTRKTLQRSKKSNESRAQAEVLASSRPIASINVKDALPNEWNDYAGFCKGAWRQQIGDRKKAMEERVRPGSMYNTMKFWQCRQCKFEGRYITPKSKKDSGFDMRIARLTDGIQFRWEFLFKSHIAAPDPITDPSKGTYGCIFCCAEGRGTPTFVGVVAFVKHLVEHRTQLPTGDVLYRMNCLVGGQAKPEEDFDINIVSKEGGLFGS